MREIQREDFLAGVARDALGRTVYRSEVACKVKRVYDIICILDKFTIAFFALAQRLFRLLAVGDVMNN